MAGLETTYTFLSIDFCSTVGNSIISGIIPSENKGLGTYLSCPSKETMRTISTAIYQYIVSFDYLYNETDYLINGSSLMYEKYVLGTDKRDNKHFQELYNNISKLNITPTSYINVYDKSFKNSKLINMTFAKEEIQKIKNPFIKTSKL